MQFLTQSSSVPYSKKERKEKKERLYSITFNSSYNYLYNSYKFASLSFFVLYFYTIVKHGESKFQVQCYASAAACQLETTH